MNRVTVGGHRITHNNNNKNLTLPYGIKLPRNQG